MNAKEIKQTLTEYLNEQKADHNEHLTIMEALKPLEGKKLDLRAQRLLPDGYTIGKNFNGYVVKSPTSKNHFICYSEGASSFSLEKAGKCNSPYNEGAKERAEKIEAVLKDSEKLKRIIRTFLELEKTYRKLYDLNKELYDGEFRSYDFPAQSNIIELTGINSRILSDLAYEGYKKE